jgi:hypothetical protein
MNLKKLLLSLAFPLALASGLAQTPVWPENYTKPGWVFQGIRGRDYLIPKVAADSASLPTYPLLWTNGTRRDSSRGAIAWTIAENKLYKWNGTTWSSVGGTTYTDAQARAAISLTTTGTSGAATYNSGTGVLNVPEYSAATNTDFIRFDSISKSIYSSNSGGTGGTSANLFNIVVGNLSGAALTSGSGNIAFGDSALKNTTIYNNNIAIGNNTLKSLNNNPSFSVSQSNNIAIGQNALQNFTSATNNGDPSRVNVAIGANSLSSLTSGARNIAIGPNSGNTLTTGQGNVLITSSRTFGTSTNENVVIGNNFGGSTLALAGGLVHINGTTVNPGAGSILINGAAGTGTNQIAIGAESNLNANGANNIGIGYRGLRPINGITSSGADNIAIGFESQSQGSTGDETINRTGVGNISIGYRSMRFVKGTAAKNIVLGHNNNRMFDDNASNQFLIGADNIVWFGKGQNQNYIINAASTATTSLTLTPSAALEINGTTGGFLPPRLTTAQRDAIASPATGLTLFCTDCTATDASTGVMQTYNGTTWKNYW